MENRYNYALGRVTNLFQDSPELRYKDGVKDALELAAVATSEVITSHEDMLRKAKKLVAINSALWLTAGVVVGTLLERRRQEESKED